MTSQLRAYRHPTLGFTLWLPPAWETVEDAEAAALTTVEPSRGREWFRANLAVTVEPLAVPASLPRWEERALAGLRENLRGLLLLDLEEIRIAGRPARRLLAHHRSGGAGSFAAVAMEQWRLVAGPRGYTLTASTSALEYGHLADVFAEMVAAFAPGPGESIA